MTTRHADPAGIHPFVSDDHEALTPGKYGDRSTEIVLCGKCWTEECHLFEGSTFAEDYKFTPETLGTQHAEAIEVLASLFLDLSASKPDFGTNDVKLKLSSWHCPGYPISDDLAEAVMYRAWRRIYHPADR